VEACPRLLLQGLSAQGDGCNYSADALVLEHAGRCTLSRSKPGKDLEELVKAIEHAIHLHSLPGVTIRVEPRKKLRDKDTGRLREFDVVITYEFAHHKVVLAIECRDRSRKIGVPEVEAFTAKCARCGVTRAVMVSDLGFAATALDKAEKNEVACLSLAQVQRFDWCAAQGVEYGERDLVHDKTWDVIAEGTPIEPAELCDQHGTPLDWAKRSEMAHRYLAMRPAALIAQQDDEARRGRATCSIQDDTSGLFVKDAAGHMIRVASLIAHVTYRIIPKFIPFNFREYIDSASGKRIASAAVAVIDGSRGKADFVLYREADGALKASLIDREPEKKG
jgi:hypothetical protein